jgi:endonuclease/exonuclease/phosphatase family metal-dependent hydrolase
MLIKVMSFNIRYGTAPDDGQSWPQRKDLVIERIRAFNPDLLGMQECRADAQATFVKDALPEYEFIGVPRGGEGESALEMAPVLYKREVFEEIERGHFWLSTTPAIPETKAWGAIFPRTVTWVKLQRRNADSGPLVFLSTHFDYEGTSREESARMLHEWAKEIVGECALIITGDFNADKGSRAYRTLTDEQMLQDVFKDYGANQGTYHDFGRAKAFEAIDWILASHHFEVKQARTDTSQTNGRYPSDHFPITASLLLREPTQMTR